MELISRPKLLSIIAILSIVSGILGVVRSLPLISLFNSIDQGGIVINDKVRVAEVQPNSPAEKSGLKIGDVLIAIDNKAVINSSEFVIKTSEESGNEIQITIDRNGQEVLVKLVPKTEVGFNEGKVGLLLTDTRIQKLPKYKLIPKVLIKGYSGYEESYSPLLLITVKSYQDESYTRLKLLFSSMLYIVIGMGLIKLRRWALYGYLSLAIVSIWLNLASIINTESVASNLLVPIFILVIEILLAVYVYSKREFFSKL